MRTKLNRPPAHEESFKEVRVQFSLEHSLRAFESSSTASISYTQASDFEAEGNPKNEYRHPREHPNERSITR